MSLSGLTAVMKIQQLRGGAVATEAMTVSADGASATYPTTEGLPGGRKLYALMASEKQSWVLKIDC